MRVKPLTMPAKRDFRNAESGDVLASDGDSGKCFAPATVTFLVPGSNRHYDRFPVVASGNGAAQTLAPPQKQSRLFHL
jgi:hypothetical protein